MSICKDRAWDTLQRLAFTRVSGTEKELEAAELLKAECEKVGVSAVIESFEIPQPITHKVCLKMTKPYEKEFYCTCQGKSGNTPEEGITAPLVYIHAGTDEDLLDVEGKIVLSTGGMLTTLRDKLLAKGALGYICTWGGFYDTEEMKNEVPHRFAIFKDFKNFPGVMMNLGTAEELLKCEPEEINMVVLQDCDHKGTSRNVVATIEGTDPKLKDEVVVFSAHFDSVEFSTGAYDNGTGSITILELMHYFNENKPKRTVKFVWCGSEEIGLLGSWNYCEMHKDELDKVILNINFDMTGTLMGDDFCGGTCHPSLVDRAVNLGKILGHHINGRVAGFMSTDSTSFAMHDVPAVSFGNMAVRGGAEIHSRRDTMEHLNANAFIKTVKFAAAYADEIVNACVNVVPREIPKESRAQEDFMYMRLGFEKPAK